MGLIEFLLLMLIAAVVGSIGQALAGYHLGGCIMSAITGFIGALIGLWLARELGLPEIFAVSVGGTTFPIIWSILGSALFAWGVGMLSRRQPSAA